MTMSGLDDYLKSIGEEPDKITPERAPAGSASAGEGETARPPAEQPSWPITRGITRGLTGMALGAPKLAGQLLPTSVRNTLGQVAENIPGVRQTREFAAEEPKSTTEAVANIGSQIGAGMLAPELGLGAKAAQVVNPAKFVRGAGWVSPPSALGSATRTLGNLAEQAGKGAAGSMITDPDEPGTAAIAGGASGVVPKVAGKAMSSPTGRYLGGKTGQLGAYLAVEEMLRNLGVPASLSWLLAAPAFKYATSPAGRPIARAGQAAFDKAGRFLGYINPAAVGAGVGQATRALNPAAAEGGNGEGEPEQ